MGRRTGTNFSYISSGRIVSGGHISMITKNAARCKNCGDVIESTHRHDFVSCKCHKEAEYLMEHFSGKKYTRDGSVTAEYRDYINKVSTGIFVDGGKEYLRRGGNFAHLEDLSVGE